MLLDRCGPRLRRLCLDGTATAEHGSARFPASSSSRAMHRRDPSAVRPHACQRSRIACEGDTSADQGRLMHGRSVPSDATADRLSSLGFEQALGTVWKLVELQSPGRPEGRLPSGKRNLPELEQTRSRDAMPLESRLRDRHRSRAERTVRRPGQRRQLPAVGCHPGVCPERHVGPEQGIRIGLRCRNRLASMIGLAVPIALPAAAFRRHPTVIRNRGPCRYRRLSDSPNSITRLCLRSTAVIIACITESN